MQSEVHDYVLVSYQVVTGLSQGYHMAYLVVTWLSQGCPNLVVTGLSQWAYQVVTGLSECRKVVKGLSQCCQAYQVVNNFGLMSGENLGHTQTVVARFGTKLPVNISLYI